MKRFESLFSVSFAVLAYSLLLCLLPAGLAAENRPRQQGTIVRMRMTDCISPHHAFMNAMAGAGSVPTGELCPEYVLVTSSVVYVILGKSSDQLVPLAESTNFRFQKNEVLIRVDDDRESRFHVKEMVLRPEWERNQRLAEAEAAMVMHQHMEGAIMMNASQ
jgi:hypothetical protein